jgi:hypothetical protein
MAKLPSQPATVDRFKRRQIKPNRCWYVRAQETLSPDEFVELEAALSDPSIQAKTISLVLTEDFGFRISSRSIGAHRQRECNCE